MSAHFIPFTEHTENNEDAWFGGLFLHWAGITAWDALASAVRDDEELYHDVKPTDGWVSPYTIKCFADKIRDMDIDAIMPQIDGAAFHSYTKEEQHEAVRACLTQLKALILDCAEKGRGVLHFH